LPPQLTLTLQEANFFDLCVAAARRAGQGTVVRVAGGWVRDKLLGLSNDDIDLAVDNCSGVAFAECLRSHLDAPDTPPYVDGEASGGFKMNVIKVRWALGLGIAAQLLFLVKIRSAARDQRASGAVFYACAFLTCCRRIRTNRSTWRRRP
jgi:hypothetical protein